MPDRTRRFSPSVRGRSPGRLTEWFASTFLTDTVALAANSFIITHSYDALELAKRPFTITRTLGTLWVFSDQQGALEFPFGALGMMVVSAKASTTGATAVLDPVTEGASDEWFQYSSFGSAQGATAQRKVMRMDFDSRAQRKVQDGEDFVSVLANSSGTDGLLFILNFRQLVKLS